MDRQYFYNELSICGKMPYVVMRQLIDQLKYINISAKLVLLEAVSSNGNLTVADWVYLLENALFEDSPTVSREVAISWIEQQCKFTRKQLIEVIESIQFEDGTPPTIYTSGGLILTKSKN